MGRRVIFLLLMLGCAPTERGTRAVSEEVLSNGGQQDTLDYVERLTGGALANERLPLVVAVHGLGDRPEHFARVFDGWTVKARVVLPAGPVRWGDGHAWMTVRSAESERMSELAAQTRDSADRIAAWIKVVSRRHPTQGKPIVTGFSQGGMLSYALATHHGDVIAAAVPVSGFLPNPLYPSNGRVLAPVYGLHGGSDDVLSVEWAQNTVKHLQEVGGEASLQVYPGVPHRVSPTMRVDWFQTLERVALKEHDLQ